MREELTRSVSLLEEQQVSPYFLSYEITETQGINVRASFGALTYSDESRRRQLDIDLRVGDYAFDNTHQLRGGPSNWSDRYSMLEIPIEDDPDAIRSALWYHTDKKKIGEKVLPETFSVYFDPTQTRSAGKDLVGA